MSQHARLAVSWKWTISTALLSLGVVAGFLHSSVDAGGVRAASKTGRSGGLSSSEGPTDESAIRLEVESSLAPELGRLAWPSDGISDRRARALKFVRSAMEASGEFVAEEVESVLSSDVALENQPESKFVCVVRRKWDSSSVFVASTRDRVTQFRGARAVDAGSILREADARVFNECGGTVEGEYDVVAAVDALRILDACATLLRSPDAARNWSPNADPTQGSGVCFVGATTTPRVRVGVRPSGREPVETRNLYRLEVAKLGVVDRLAAELKRGRAMKGQSDVAEIEWVHVLQRLAEPPHRGFMKEWACATASIVALSSSQRDGGGVVIRTRTLELAERALAVAEEDSGAEEWMSWLRDEVWALRAIDRRCRGFEQEDVRVTVNRISNLGLRMYVQRNLRGDPTAGPERR